MRSKTVFYLTFILT